MRLLILLALSSLCACSWLHGHAKPQSPSAELIVTGAPGGSAIFIDDVQHGDIAEANGKPQSLAVTPGEHIVELRAASVVIYREQTYVGNGERRVIEVLSGTSRE